MKTYHLIISGKVQGVFYRASARKAAIGFGINGWIKNTPDEKVEVVITGDIKLLDQFISWCWSGPENAKVDDVIISEIILKIFAEFRIIR